MYLVIDPHHYTIYLRSGRVEGVEMRTVRYEENIQVEMLGKHNETLDERFGLINRQYNKWNNFNIIGKSYI